MIVKVMIAGRGYDAAQHIPEQLALAEQATLDDALEAINRLLPDGHPLAASCLVAISGEHVGTVGVHPSRRLHEGDELVIIAPVAGG
jgi:molybdopterin converting factor small subunit